jgi:hypothetical protein
VAEVKKWEGTAAELAAALRARITGNPANWPASPEALGKRLKEVTGIIITRGHGGKDGKQRIIRLSEPTENG